MAWKAVHPGLTEKVRVPADGPEFELQFWPPREAARINLLQTKLHSVSGKLDFVKDYERVIEMSGLDHDNLETICRFGVKGWAGFDAIECKTEEVEIDGRKHTALTKESLLVLHVNKLLFGLATKCCLMNWLSEDQKKTSSLRSESSTATSTTPAASVIPNSPPEPIKAESSESMASTSKDAPTP